LLDHWPQDLLELKMKGMGIKVKILSQEAVDFMQFDPMHKVEDILRDMASRVLPDRYAHSLPPNLGTRSPTRPVVRAPPVRRGIT
jgi:hypothetical protein